MNINDELTTSIIKIKAPKGSYIRVEYTTDFINWNTIPVIRADGNGDASLSLTWNTSKHQIYFRSSLVRPESEYVAPLLFQSATSSPLKSLYRKLFPVRRPPIELKHP